jgi:hypothetical protein
MPCPAGADEADPDAEMADCEKSSGSTADTAAHNN